MTTQDISFRTPLPAMVADVAGWCEAKGWANDGRTFGDEIALIHSELDEVAEAFWTWGLEAPAGEKPEGVGSEFADVLIRILDTLGRHKLSPFGDYSPTRLELGVALEPALLVLHYLASRALEAYRDEGIGEKVACELRALLVALRTACTREGIDLEAEYHRKMSYNWTRAFRHGGRAI